MTDQERKAMEMALEALEELRKDVTGNNGAPELWDAYYAKQGDALDALRQALAQPEPWDTSDMAYRPNGLSVEQEPVAWWSTLFNVTYIPPENFNVWESNAYKAGQLQPLYTAPPSNPWVSLTDEKLDEIVFDCGLSATPKDIARAIEAALRSKNNG